jgi:hypothetical protein
MSRHDLLALMAAVIQAGSLAHPNCCELRPDAAVIDATRLLDAVQASLRGTRYVPVGDAPFYAGEDSGG